MKLFLQGFANVIILLVALYLPFGFILDSYNPSNWHEIIRALYVLAVMATIMIAIDQYKRK